MKGRNLVVMFDGTWDDNDDDTNVTRMYNAIDKVDKGKLAREEARDGEPVQQLVKYIEGVGTGWSAKVSGGAFGYGLSEKVKEGYCWLSTTYQPHDQIFVFGFSRGAFTARALVSFMHECGGLLKKVAHSETETRIEDGNDTKEGRDTKELIEKAFDLYSKVVAEEKDFPKYLEEKKQFGRSYCRKVRVKMIGVWDTVGALALSDRFLKFEPAWYNWPLRAFAKVVRGYIPASWTREYYWFYNMSLPCIVDEAYHALAIDEHRLDFPPHIWDSRKELDPADQTDDLIVPKEQKLKQCWFAGSHSNVGGGIDENPEAPWQLSFEWMQGKAEKAGLRFKSLYKSNFESWKWQGELEDSYANFLNGWYSKFIKPINRAIIRETVPKMKMEGSRAEKLHRSVKLRMEKNPGYRPLALECHANEFGSAYDSATNKDDLNKKTAFVYAPTGRYSLRQLGNKYHTVIPFDPMVPIQCTCKGTPRFHPPRHLYESDNYVYRHPLILENRLDPDGKSYGLVSYFVQPL